MDCAFLEKWLINEKTVETVVLLAQREKRADISLSLDIKPKASKAETKATYKEIKEYVILMN